MLDYLNIKNYRFLLNSMSQKLSRVNLPLKITLGKLILESFTYLHANVDLASHRSKVLRIVKKIILKEVMSTLLITTTTFFYKSQNRNRESFKELEISSNLDKTTISLG